MVQHTPSTQAQREEYSYLFGKLCSIHPALQVSDLDAHMDALTVARIRVRALIRAETGGEVDIVDVDENLSKIKGNGNFEVHLLASVDGVRTRFIANFTRTEEELSISGEVIKAQIEA